MNNTMIRLKYRYNDKRFNVFHESCSGRERLSYSLDNNLFNLWINRKKSFIKFNKR